MNNQYDSVLGAVLSGLSGLPSQISARLGLKGPSVRRVLGDLLSQGLVRKLPDGSYASPDVDAPDSTLQDVYSLLEARATAAYDSLIENAQAGRAAVGSWGSIAGMLPSQVLKSVESPQRRRLTLGDVERILDSLVLRGALSVDSGGVYSQPPIGKASGTIYQENGAIARLWREGSGYRYFYGPNLRRQTIRGRKRYNYDDVVFVPFEAPTLRGGFRHLKTAFGSIGGETVPVVTFPYNDYVVIDWDKKRHDIGDVILGNPIAIQESRGGGVHLIYDRKIGLPPRDVWDKQDKTYEKLAKERGFWGLRIGTRIIKLLLKKMEA